MKKLLAVLLCIVMMLSLVACGGDEDRDETPDNVGNNAQIGDNNNENTEESTEETTLPAEPTQEEREQLEEYVVTVGKLNEASSRGNYVDYQELYPKLLELESVDAWVGTDYATWAYNAAEDDWSCVDYFDVEKDWGRQAVLARFDIVKDAYLGHTVTTEDNLGNTNATEHAYTRSYWSDGNVRDWKQYRSTNNFVKDLTNSWEEIAQSDINSTCFDVFRVFKILGDREYDEAGRVVKITDESAGTINALYEVIYNADGTINKIVKKTNKDQEEYGFNYENNGKFVTVTFTKEGNLGSYKFVIEYTYNDADKLIKEEMKHLSIGYKETWDQAELTEFGVMEYVYDADGKLATGTYTYQDNLGDNPYSRVTNQYAFETDAEGRVTKVVETLGDKETWNTLGEYIGTTKADNAKITYDLHYGDFYIYTPVE